MRFRPIVLTALASGALLTGGVGIANAGTVTSAPHSKAHQQVNEYEHRHFKPSDHRYKQYEYDNRDHKDHLFSWQYKYDRGHHKYTWQWAEN